MTRKLAGVQKFSKWASSQNIIFLGCALTGRGQAGLLHHEDHVDLPVGYSMIETTGDGAGWL